MNKNRCSTLVLSLAIGAFLICAATAQAVAAAGPVASHLTASVSGVQPAVSGLFQVKAPRVWNNGVPAFLDTWDAFQSRTSSASLNKAYAFTTIDGLGHQVLYAGVERASSKGPVVFEFSQLEGERSVGDLRIEAEIDNAGSIGTVQFQSYSGDGGKSGLKLFPIAILAGEGCSDAGTACVVANGASLEVGVNLSQLLNGSGGRFKAAKITTPEDSVVGTFVITPFAPLVDGCLSDPTSFGSVPGCTANDINLTAVAPGTCSFTANSCTGNCDSTTAAADYTVANCGQVTLTGCIGQFNITATTRYDVGLYISTDGDPNGDFAKSGTCSRNAWNSDSPLTAADTDTCGDVNAKGQTIGLPIPNTTILCVDSDDDGKVDISHCETWSNSAEQLICNSSAGVKPGTTSKCNCGVLAGACIPFPLDDECKENVCELRCGGVPSGTACTSNAQCATGVFCLDTLVEKDKADGTSCGTGGDLCSGLQTCQAGVCETGDPVTCDPPAECRAEGVCDPQTGICSYAITPGAACGDQSSGLCDDPNTCNADGTCNPNNKADDEECGAATGVCDLPDLCKAGVCTDQGFVPASENKVCGPAQNECDAEEKCLGTGPDCPADQCAGGDRPANHFCSNST